MFFFIDVLDYIVFDFDEVYKSVFVYVVVGVIDCKLMMIVDVDEILY